MIAAIDIDTLLRFKKGDEAAFSAIHRRLQPMLLYQGRRLVRDPFVAETVVQDSFLRLWRFRECMESELHVYRFLRLVTRWGCFGYFKNARQRFERTCVLYSEHMDCRPYHRDLGHLREQVQAEERLRLIYRVIPYLPPTRHNVFTLHFRYGFSVQQIAERMGRSDHSIRTELLKSLEHLRRVLNRPKLPTDEYTTAAAQPAAPPLAPPAGCTSLQQQVFTLRRIEKWGFDRIARELQLDQSRVQCLYVEACTLAQSGLRNNLPLKKQDPKMLN